jgi:uncharacterized membrane protein YphA (DoxX/SURF4 family)
MRLRNLPPRLTTGGYIFHSGLEKWNAGPEQAEGMHGMAVGSFPALKNVSPPTFLKLLAVGEMATGALLLAPVVSPVKAGAALTVFSSALLTMYARTPGMRQPGSIWPTPDGIGLAKDVWMLGIGSGLILGGLTDDVRSVAKDAKKSLTS